MCLWQNRGENAVEMVYPMAMEKWLDIPKDRKRLPVGRLCLILALTILMMLALIGRKAPVLAELGLAVFGLA